MNCQRFCTILLFLSIGWNIFAAEPVKRPNVLVILADDLGYGDLVSYGATKIKTPNIDRLANEGVRFTDAHSTAAVCQPGRYGVLTGTYFVSSKRNGPWQLYYHEGQTILPQLMKSAGYRTAAIGKWHQGFGRGKDPDYNEELKPGPLEVGFDYFFGTPLTHSEPPFVFVENHRMYGYDPADPIHVFPPAPDEPKAYKYGETRGAEKAHAARPGDQLDLIFAEKAIKFIEKKPEEPFFLYYAPAAVHVPIAPAPEFQGTSQTGRYGDFIHQLDASVGKILDTLKALNLYDNTLIIFTSDNGGVKHREPLMLGHDVNGTLLGQKTDGWEGGHRVPFIVKWTGHIPAGTQCDKLLGTTDILATVSAAVGMTVPEGVGPDSINQLSLLLDPKNAPAVRNELLILGVGSHVLRQGDWLYIPRQGSAGMTVPVPPGPLWGIEYEKHRTVNSDIDEKGNIKPGAPENQLYNLKEDLEETTNVVREHPELAKQLKTRLDEIIQVSRKRFR